MNYRIIFVFSFLLIVFFTKGHAQEGGGIYTEENEDEIWYQVIDYLAATLTYEYILEFEKKKPLNQQEKESFDRFREQLANSTIDRPFGSNALRGVLNESFQRTYDNLTQKIYSFKSLEPKTAELLFRKTDSILVEVKSDLKSSVVYDDIKTNVYSELDKNERELDDNDSRVKEEVVSNNKSKPESFVPEWFYKFSSGILFLTSIFFFILYIHVRNKARRLENSSEESPIAVNKRAKVKNNKMGKWDYGDDFPTRPESKSSANKEKRELENYDRENINKTTSPKTQSLIENKFDKNEKQTFSSQSPKTRSISKDTHLPVDTRITGDHYSNNVLYAGKPTNEGWFKNAERLQSDSHIYELKLLNDSEAEFSLLELSNYMETEVINSPDEYLYRVCINENSNQEYRKEIITTKKGIAHKMDGKWKVNEEYKAKIKFQ